MEDPSPATNSDTIDSTNLLKRNSDDMGWEFGELVIIDGKLDKDKVKCKLCGRVVSGGVHRIKQHVARIKGNVVSCNKSTPIDQARYKEALQQVKVKKNTKKQRLQEVYDQVSITQQQALDDDSVVVIDSTSSTPHTLGPMDGFVRPISPLDTKIAARKKSRQQNINDALFKSRSNQVHAYLAQWVYESGIPFNAINNDAFHQLLEAVGQFGPGYIPPTQYQLREPLLKQAVEKTKEVVKKQEEEWKKMDVQS